MDFLGLKIAAHPDGASTNDIISALAAAVPGAVANVLPHIDQIVDGNGDPIQDGIRIARYIQAHTKYNQDGYSEQLIQLPGRMLFDTKAADCKSFSLAWLAMMIAAGHKNLGFRFASYRPNKQFTHVYNWILVNRKKVIFDTTLKNLAESPTYTNLKDMKVSYLAGTPTMVNDMVEIAQAARIEGIGRKRKQEDKPKRGRKIELAPVRGAFLSLVALNVRGLATKLAKSAAKEPKTARQFWEKLGGRFDKLMDNVNKGKRKKALFGKGKGINGATAVEYLHPQIGIVDWAAVGAFLATATPALVAASKLFKKQGIPEDGGDVADDAQKASPDANLDKDGQGFTASDDENEKSGSGFSFKPSPLLIGGGIAAVAALYFLTRKSRK